MNPDDFFAGLIVFFLLWFFTPPTNRVSEMELASAGSVCRGNDGVLSIRPGNPIFQTVIRCKNGAQFKTESWRASR